MLFLACSIGTALAPNLVAFFILRALTAFQGTSFLIVGASVIGDMYKPTERATAMGWFLSGTLIGPGLSPLAGTPKPFQHSDSLQHSARSSVV